LKLKIYPNPATEFAIVEFELQQGENVNINLVSSLGQQLACVSNEPYQPGKQQIRIDLGKYPVGIFILTIHAGDIFNSGKLSIFR